LAAIVLKDDDELLSWPLLADMSASLKEYVDSVAPPESAAAQQGKLDACDKLQEVCLCVCVSVVACWVPPWCCWCSCARVESSRRSPSRVSLTCASLLLPCMCRW
jgi:hypothetical protein